jgi:AraC-like DNA-binding protein
VNANEATVGVTASFESWASRLSVLARDRGRPAIGDVAAARRRILDITDGGCRFALQGGSFNAFTDTEAKFGRTLIQFLRWESEANCETSIQRSAERHLTLHIPLSGAFEAVQGSRRARVCQGQLLIVDSPGFTQRRWLGCSDLLNLIIKRESLRQVLASEYGLDNDSAPTFGPFAVVGLNQVATLARFIETIVWDLTEPDPSFSHATIGQQAERTLLLLLLKGVSNSVSERLLDQGRRLAPYYVQRAERYIRQNFASEITIELLARATGVSARTLFNGFGEYRNTTPMKFVKSLRLEIARRSLIEARLSGRKVIDVANAVGYNNLSQFSRDYKKRFFETPITTIRHG